MGRFHSGLPALLLRRHIRAPGFGNVHGHLPRRAP
jgi:hypothetical protein